MKLSEVQERLQGLLKITEKKFPAKIGYAIAKNIEKLGDENKNLEQQRVKLCEMYAQKDENGKPETEEGKFIFSTEEKQKFEEEYKGLLNEEVELEIHNVDVIELQKCDLNERYDAPTAQDYMIMEFMFK